MAPLPPHLPKGRQILPWNSSLGATSLEQEGKGYVVASLGTDSGYVPYTAFSAKQSYIDENPDVIQGFTNALQKGMDYVQAHTPEEIAAVIEPQFKETDLDDHHWPSYPAITNRILGKTI